MPEVTPWHESLENRVGHKERDSVSSFVTGAYAEGYLDDAELDDRISAILKARTWGELARIVADVPGRPPLPRRPAGVVMFQWWESLVAKWEDDSLLVRIPGHLLSIAAPWALILPGTLMGGWGQHPSPLSVILTVSAFFIALILSLLAIMFACQWISEY